MKKSLSQFRLEKLTARKRALQFIYGMDTRHDWTFFEDDFDNFRDMALDFEDDSDQEDAEWLDKAYLYAKTIISGVAAQHDELDMLISEAADNWALRRISIIDRCLIRLASYEMKNQPSITPATAINEAIELAKQFGEADSPRFVNGVLDRIRLTIAPAETAAAQQEPPEAPASDTSAE